MNTFARDLMDEEYQEELDTLLRSRPRGTYAPRGRFDLDYDGETDVD